MLTKLNLKIANVDLVKGPQLVVVDTGAPGSALKILAALARQRPSSARQARTSLCTVQLIRCCQTGWGSKFVG